MQKHTITADEGRPPEPSSFKTPYEQLPPTHHFSGFVKKGWSRLQTTVIKEQRLNETKTVHSQFNISLLCKSTEKTQLTIAQRKNIGGNNTTMTHFQLLKNRSPIAINIYGTTRKIMRRIWSQNPNYFIKNCINQSILRLLMTPLTRTQLGVYKSENINMINIVVASLIC